MRYFFDIHLNGQCQLDERGQDFRSLEDARNYVITCGRICLTDGLPRERSVLAQCIIEITDREGLERCRDAGRRDPSSSQSSARLQRAANAFGIG